MAQVNAQIKDAVTTTAEATTSATVTKNFGQGLAFQSVSSTAGLVVSDAGNMLRNVSMVCTAGITICTLKMIAEKDPTYAPFITLLQDVIQQTGVTFEKIGTDAANVMTQFVPQ